MKLLSILPLLQLSSGLNKVISAIYDLYVSLQTCYTIKIHSNWHNLSKNDKNCAFNKLRCY